MVEHSNPSPTGGRPPSDFDWDELDRLLVLGATQIQLSHILQTSISTLNSRCKAKHDLTLAKYKAKLKKVTPAPFSPSEIFSLLRSYYSGGLAKYDRREKLPRVKAITYGEHTAPRTGKSLFELVTYPRLDAVMMELKSLSLQIGGVTVRDGAEYALRVYCNPKAQSNSLPPLMKKNPNKDYWEPTKLGYELIGESLVSFHRYFNEFILINKEPLIHGEINRKSNRDR